MLTWLSYLRRRSALHAWIRANDGHESHLNVAGLESACSPGAGGGVLIICIVFAISVRCDGCFVGTGSRMNGHVVGDRHDFSGGARSDFDSRNDDEKGLEEKKPIEQP